MLIPIALPPGYFRNGTALQGAGRWRDGNLVRWQDGAMRPVGGWAQRVNMVAPAPRGALSWRDLAGNRYLAAGSYNKLVVANAGGVVTDITPVGLTAGTLDAAINLGYGGGFYGVGTYGTARADNGTYSEVTTWSMDNWGEYLVACSTTDGRLWEWRLNIALDAAVIAGAPTGNRGLVVSAERFLFALGAGGNPRKVQWSDRETNTTWTAAATNEAGDQELQTTGQIMQGIRARGQVLILTDQDAHTATYQGPPFVYGFERVGTACGAISRNAAAAVDAGVFWMGDKSFFTFTGGGVQSLECEVGDFVFPNLNTAQKSKIYAVSNSLFGEITWFYPDEGSNENNRYVSYNYKLNHWTFGAIARSAGVDAGVFSKPIWFSPAGIAYNHETGLSYDGAVIYAETGPFSLGNGDQVMSITQLISDETTLGDVSATFTTRFHPTETPRSYGPYLLGEPTSVRFTGRQVTMRINAMRLADWRVGVMRFNAIPRGGR